MGHSRLGKIPKSQKWMDVIATLSGGDSGGVSTSAIENVDEIAKQTITAAQQCLKAAVDDQGLQYTFYLLAQVALASRSEDWRARLRELGIHIGSGDSLLEFVAEFQNAIDNYRNRRRLTSDICEIAQQAAGEALTVLAAPKSQTLFGSGPEELRSAVKDFSTTKGFSRLGQKFFGNFMARFTNFYLSRLTAAQLGRKNLADIGELSRFNEALQSHCEQSARIVHDFCGEWYSKTEYMEGINLDNTSRFMAVALRKLSAELGKQEAEL
jgi:hypothetical protein